MFSGIWDSLTTDRGPLNGHPYEIHVYVLHEFLGLSRAVTLPKFPLSSHRLQRRPGVVVFVEYTYRLLTTQLVDDMQCLIFCDDTYDPLPICTHAVPYSQVLNVRVGNDLPEDRGDMLEVGR